MVYLLKMVIFHGYVNLPEGNYRRSTTFHQGFWELSNTTREGFLKRPRIPISDISSKSDANSREFYYRQFSHP